MASTSNLFAALVGLTETPESTTDSTDEDGFIEIRSLCRLHVFSGSKKFVYCRSAPEDRLLYIRRDKQPWKSGTWQPLVAESGSLKCRRKHKGRTSQPAGRAPGNHGKQQGQQRRQQYQSQRQQQERTSTGRPAGTSAQNGGPAAKEAHEADLAESLDHATLR